MALSEEEERYRALVDHSPIAMLIHRDGVIVYCNRTAVKVFGGRDVADLVGRNPLDLLHPDERQAIAERIGQMLRTGEPAPPRLERFVRLDDGREIVAEVAGGRISYGGRPASQVCAVDITERRRLEEQLRQAQKMESVGLLAGGIAHDFNNLLTPIIGGSELLLLGDLPAGSEEIVREMRQAAERLKELTQQLLAFSRKQVLELRNVDLREVVGRFARILRRTLRENIRIDVALAPDLGGVRADASQLEQVLLNLAINAQDAMPAGGVLAIAGGNVELDAAEAVARPGLRPGGHVLLSVRDTGSGIDERARERLFEPFFTTKERGRGTGLGLSMVYGIVKQHGGAISVRSAPGEGSTFDIWLPRRSSAEAPERAGDARTRDVGARGGETVLVVEDDDAVRKTASEMLRQLGYEVIAADGPDASWRAAAGHPARIDLLLTDVVLASSDGKRVYERLRRERPGLRVLYMSGYLSDVIVHEGVVDEGVQLIQKPLSLQALSAKVRDVLDGPA